MSVPTKVPSIEKQIEELKEILGEDSKDWVPPGYPGFPGSQVLLEQWNPHDITRLWSLAIRNLSCVQLHDLMYEKMFERCSETGETDPTVSILDLKAVYDGLQRNFAAYEKIVAVYGYGPWPEFPSSKPLVTWDTPLLRALAAVVGRHGPESKDPMLNIYIPSALQARSAGRHAHLDITDIKMAEACYHVDEIKKNWNTISVKLEDWFPEGTMQHPKNPEKWPVNALYWLWKLSTMTLPKHCDAVKDSLLARLKTRQRWNPGKILLTTDDARYVCKILEPKLKAIHALKACWGPSHVLWLPFATILKLHWEPIRWDTGILYSLSLLAKSHPNCEWRRFLVGKMVDTIKQLNRKDGLITAGIIDLVAMTFGREKNAKDGKDSTGGQVFTPGERLLTDYEEKENIRLKKESNKLEKNDSRRQTTLCFRGKVN